MKSLSKMMAFFIRHPQFFRNLISQYYPLTLAQLKHYKNELDWCMISSNTKIQWDFDIIAKFVDDIDWEELTINDSAFKDITLLDIFSERIHWFENKDCLGVSLSANCGLPWSMNFIHRFEKRIDFDALSSNTMVPWSEELVDNYLGKWNEEKLSENESFPWGLRLFEKYLDTTYLGQFRFQISPIILSDFDLVEKYYDHMCWYKVCSNPSLPWKEKDLLKRWADRIDWAGICNNELLMADPEFFDKHIDIWLDDTDHYFFYLSLNEHLPWKKDFLEKYANYWDWQRVSTNPGIPWTLSLIELFSKKICWGKYYNEPITEDINGNQIEPIPSISYRRGIFDNPSFPWTLELLLKFEPIIHFDELIKEPNIWEKLFKDYIDDEFLDYAMRII